MDSMIEMQNKSIVEILYKALLGQGTMEMVAKLLASDLEYWFHGPPKCQHMMKVLTGETDHKKGFKFEPRSVTSIGDCVITEGWEGQAYWVHVWTLKNGLITQFREYFNTWLVVRDLRPLKWQDHKQDSMTLWRSQPRDLYRRSLPGLVLAI
jgi:ketosteroid isomerase-like protein